MDNFEEEVQYFTELVFKNIQKAKARKKRKDEMVFFNLDIRKDGQEIAIFNQEKDYVYTILTKDIEEFNFKQYLIKELALRYIKKLTKYASNEITFEEFADIPKETNPVVKNIIQQKNNISEQLRLLRKNRNIPEVQEYIEEIYNDKYATEYMKYLIDKYFYVKKNLIKPQKNALEKFHKMLLR